MPRTLWWAAATALTAACLPPVAPTAVTPPPAQAGAAGSDVRADFNGDGYSDLVVTALQRTVGGHEAAGAVSVQYGGPDGVAGTRSQLWSQDSP